MVPTERLYEIAECQGIILETHPLPPPVLGHYFVEPGIAPIITLSNGLDGRECLLRSVLAEELGHHFTTTGTMIPTSYCHYTDRVKVSRAEYRALCWAAKTLMPVVDVRAALAKGLREAWEIAEDFGVTEVLARFRLRMLKTTGAVNMLAV